MDNKTRMAQGGFHQRRHGRAIRLLEGGRVAERVGKNVDTDGVVFSEKPIPVGSVFQVRLEDKVMTGVGTLVGWNNFVWRCWALVSLTTLFLLQQAIGFTSVPPGTYIPPSLGFGVRGVQENMWSNYWVVDDTTCHHGHDTPKRGNFLPADLQPGGVVGVKVTPDEEMLVTASGKEPVTWNLAWKTKGLIDRPLWGVVDVYGCARKIRADYRIAGG